MDIDRNAVVLPLRAVCDDVKRNMHCLDTGVFFPQIDAFYLAVASLVRSRGASCLFLEFPEVGKLYDKCLSTGVMDMNSLPTIFSHGSVLFKTLLSESMDRNGVLFDELDENIVFFTRTILCLYKKVRISCPPETVSKAVSEFVSIERSLRVPDGTWDSDAWIPHRFTFGTSCDLHHTIPRGRRLWNIADVVFAAIVPSSVVSYADVTPGHGPGAVSDIKFGKDKYTFPYWPSKLEGFFSAWDYAFHKPILRGDSNIGYDKVILDRREPPARLIAVPKTLKSPRLIASEPTAHQFLQQGLMKWIRSNLSPLCRNSINFSDQKPSQEAALLASKVGDVSTVDLSAASDRLSCWVVERALGTNQSLLSALHSVRTRTIVDGTKTHPDLSIRIRKFAAQGSAVTFPIQSIVYFGLCLAALCFVEGIWNPKPRDLRRLGGKVRVFGDDLIVPTIAVPVLSAMLDSLQLKVNVQKTHTSGAFRESCGMDAYKGQDVTPCYLSDWQITTSPLQLQSWIDVLNNAHRKGLWSLSKWMESCIPANMARCMITTNTLEGDGTRLYTYSNGFVTDSKSRYNHDLQRTEYKVLVFRPSLKIRGRMSYQDLHQWFVEGPEPDCKWVSGYPVRKATHVVSAWVWVA